MHDRLATQTLPKKADVTELENEFMLQVANLAGKSAIASLVGQKEIVFVLMPHFEGNCIGKLLYNF